MKKLFTLLFFSISLVGFSQQYQNVESVEYDPAGNRFFVSNSTSIIERSSDGSLSYFGSAVASHGMEVMGNTLFAIQGTTVRGYDLITASQVMTISIPGASFLNGMTNDGVSNIYVTDFSARKIHRIDVSDLDAPTSEVLVSNTITTPNGIVYDADNNRLIFVAWGGSASVKALDLTDLSVSTLTTTPYGNIDGIDEDNNGDYYISYWSAGTRISKYDSDFANPPQTITVSGLTNPADICYAKQIDTLAIPHSGNQVTFLSFEPTGINEKILNSKFNVHVYPNPISANTSIDFSLDQNSLVSLELYDVQGKLLHQITHGKQVAGEHRFVIGHLDLPSGIILGELEIDGENISFQMIKQ